MNKELPKVDPKEHGRCRNCGHGDSLINGLCGFCNKIKSETRCNFAKEIDKFLIETATEDDTARLRKLNDWIMKEKFPDTRGRVIIHDKKTGKKFDGNLSDLFPKKQEKEAKK